MPTCKCGQRTTGSSLCKQCALDEKYSGPVDDVDLEADGGLTNAAAFDDDGIDHDDPDSCKALGSGGRQCTNGYTTDAADQERELCGTHAKTDESRLTRVDEIDGEPDADLRDRLVDAGMNGGHAYRFAAEYDDAVSIWKAITALEPTTIAGRDYDEDGLAVQAEHVADLDGVDAGDHPLARGDCVAVVEGGVMKGDEYACTNGTYGTKLLCGTHASANDPDTIFDRDDGPTLVDATFTALDDEHVDQGDTVGVYQTLPSGYVIVTEGYRMKRVPGHVVDVSGDDQAESDSVDDDEDADVSEDTTDDGDTSDENDDGEVWIDPIAFDNRVGELEDAGLSEREAQVVAAKDQGFTHPEIAEYLSERFERDFAKSTVDEYSRRARRKIERARALIATAAESYEDDDADGGDA